MERQRERYALFVLLILLFGVVLLRTAWMGDDVYITFRTVENLIAGYGPTYNVMERVQTYTHPLWMLSLAAVYFSMYKVLGITFWAQLYYIALFLGIFFSIGTMAVLVSRIARSTFAALLGGTILILSKAFVDYSTSGLENPLTHFILVVFLYLYFRWIDEMDARRMTLLSLTAALMVLNRPDTVLLVLPALAYLFWEYPDKKRALRSLGLGFLPVILWELFATFYYGFPFPNTAYAKLHTGIGSGSLLTQGFYYFLNSLDWDPLTLLVIAAGLAWSLLSGRREQLAVSAGVVLYLLYTLKIGGDFMSGRYFAAPLLMTVVLLSRCRSREAWVYGALFAVVLLVGLGAPRNPLWSDSHYAQKLSQYAPIDENGIADERQYYYEQSGLLLMNRYKSPPGSGRAGRKWRVHKGKYEVKLVGPLGVAGYIFGPDVHVIDRNALADPLMARLPVEDTTRWRIGHFHHLLPDGYLETLSSGENHISDPNLARYYDKLSLVIREDLFRRERLVEIWRLNSGQYNYLIDAYLASSQ